MKNDLLANRHIGISEKDEAADASQNRRGKSGRTD